MGFWAELKASFGMGVAQGKAEAEHDNVPLIMYNELLNLVANPEISDDLIETEFYKLLNQVDFVRENEWAVQRVVDVMAKSGRLASLLRIEQSLQTASATRTLPR